MGLQTVRGQEVAEPVGKRIRTPLCTYRSDKSDGPTVGTETADPLEFLARVLVHIPDKGHVTTRYYGLYDNRPRGMRVKAAPADGGHSSREGRARGHRSLRRILV